MARYLLHIGDAKCGSTAIQAALSGAHEELAAQGILYKTSRSDANHAGFAIMAGHKVRTEPGKHVIDAVETIRYLSANAGNYDWIVLSAESFLDVSPQALIKILGLASRSDPEVTAVCYVRDPVSMYLSSVQQELKGSHFFTHPDKFRRPIHGRLAAWQDYLGANHLHVRRFDRSTLTGGDVVRDFQSCLESVTGQAVPLESGEANTSLTAEQMRVMQLYRRRIYPNDAGKIMRGSQSLARLFQQLNIIRPIGQKAALNESAENIIYHNNKEDFCALMENFDLDFKVRSRETILKEPYFWNGSKNVASILSSCDDGLVDEIAETLPEFSKSYCARKSDKIIQNWSRGDEYTLSQIRKVYSFHAMRLAKSRICLYIGIMAMNLHRANEYFVEALNQIIC